MGDLRSKFPGLPERFDLEKVISQSANGEIIQAFNHDRHMRVALKLLRAEGSRTAIATAMFDREVTALRGLDHPAIVHILDSFVCDDGLLCIELEFIHGGKSLRDYLEDIECGRRERPPTCWRLGMALRLCEAVIEAHRRDVIHRDIKPANVLWNRDDDQLKLADFGIAAVLSLMVNSPAGVTLRNFFTPPFAPPEQLLQRPVNTQSDVYSFGLLVAALLAVKEPCDEFEPAMLQDFVAQGLGELSGDGAAESLVIELSEMLDDCLADEPNKRPSLTQLKDVLERVSGSLVPRPVACLEWTSKAKKKLESLGFTQQTTILEDLNKDLRVQFKRDSRGESVKLFGRTLWVIAKITDDDPDGENELRILDAGQNTGPTHERHRKSAMPGSMRIRFGRGDSKELLRVAREGDRATTQRRTDELVERARLINRIEREQLPVFRVHAEVLGGKRLPQRRASRVGQASGYRGSSTEKVTVNNGYRLKITHVRTVTMAHKKNVVRAALHGERQDEWEDMGDEANDGWSDLFDDVGDIDVLDIQGNLVGKATRYDTDSNVLHVKTDKPRDLLRVGDFFVKDYQKERLLKQQDTALEVLERGETARADMPRLLAEASAHHMGEKPWIELLQKGLLPEDRVRNIIRRILASDGVFCLQGPPGTGKTTIITEVVAQVLEANPGARILVCSQANDAVVNAMERILKIREEHNRQWLCVRDVRNRLAKREGAWSGYEAAYKEFSKKATIAARKQLKKLPPQSEYKEVLAEWTRALETRSHKLVRDHRGLVQIWGTTTARSTSPLNDLEDQAYDLVIVDEAAKATMGEVLVPIVRARKLLLVGDQKQLPPFLEYTTAQALEQLGITEEEAKKSLFEHLFELVPRGHRDMLDMQFRMHPTIGNVISAMFYSDKLRNGPGTEQRPLPVGEFDRDHRVMWVDVVGEPYSVGKTSWANKRERKVIYTLLDRLNADAAAADMKLSVAVIAGYRGQADELRSERRDTEGRWSQLTVTAATVDSFQGREADVVIYSLVLTGERERKFLADCRRFNVALSRARSLLILVGDRKGARGTPLLQQLLELIPEENQLPAEHFETTDVWANRLAERWGATYSR